MLGLGRSFLEAGEPASARVVFAEAARRHPDRDGVHAWLGTALLEENELAGAQRAFATALALDEGNRRARCGIAIVHERNGDRDAAAAAWHRTFDDAPIPLSVYRGAGEPVRILLVCSAVGGNVQWPHFLDDRRFQWSTLFAESYHAGMSLPRCDIAFNAIGDPDLASWALERAGEALAVTGIPVLNDPRRVRATGRRDVAACLAGIPGVRTPRMASFRRAKLSAGDAEALLARAGFAWPLLLRAPGYHSGEHFTLLRSAADLPAALASLPGDELLAIDYVDTRAADGLVRKHRVMLIAGRLYPLHLAISSEWKVHYFSAAMENDAFRAEERAFLSDMRGALGDAALRALEHIAAVLGLDYAGVDFALDRDGGIVVFEANATMAIAPPGSDQRWEYRRAPVGRAADAVRNMIDARARVPRPS